MSNAVVFAYDSDGLSYLAHSSVTTIGRSGNVGSWKPPKVASPAIVSASEGSPRAGEGRKDRGYSLVDISL